MRNGPYTLIVAPQDFPGKRYRGRYVYEHVYNYWKTYGVLPKEGEVIHHRDESYTHNNPFNLQLATRAGHNGHSAAHQIARGKKK